MLNGERNGSASAVSYINTGWQQSEEGAWWYREQDGSYPQKNWLYDNGCWYFFDSTGYLVKESYVKWGNSTYFVDKDGKMLTGGQAPDGRLAGTDGALSWPKI